MIGFLAKLLSSEDVEVDSIHVAGMAAMAAAIAMTAYAVYVTPVNYSPVAFGTGAASILAAIGGGRRLRDGCPAPQDHDEDGTK